MAQVSVNDQIRVSVHETVSDVELDINVGSHTITVSEYEFDRIAREGDLALSQFYRNRSQNERERREQERQAALDEAAEELLGLVRIVFPDADLVFDGDDEDVDLVDDYVVDLNKDYVSAGLDSRWDEDDDDPFGYWPYG